MKNFTKEFKEFINNGNFFELAIAVVIGGALKDVVTSLVNYLIMPITQIFSSKSSFEQWTLQLGNLKIQYGLILQSLLNFVIISLVVFTLVKLINKFKREKKPEEPTVDKSEELLAEIRDLLAKER